MLPRFVQDRQITRRLRPGSVTISGVVLAAVVAGLGLLVGDPMVFPMRAIVVTILVAVAVLASVLALVSRRGLTAALLAVAAGFVAWQEVGPYLDRAAVLNRTDAAALGVERHFVVGFRDQEAARELALGARVGGLFLTRRNVMGHDLAGVSSLVAGLQNARNRAGLAPLVIAADQEGGLVSHLSPPLSPPAALSSLADLSEPLRHAEAERVGAEQGAALRSICVTLDLAPVSDLMPTRPPSVLDMHTRIATRAISADPQSSPTSRRVSRRGCSTPTSYRPRSTSRGLDGSRPTPTSSQRRSGHRGMISSTPTGCRSARS